MRRLSAAFAAVLAAALLAPAAGAAATVPEVDLAMAALQDGVAGARSLAAAAAEPDGAGKARGLERAAAALDAAAERKANREGKDAPQGRARGRGHSAAVHAYLLEGRSPSELPSHGRQVSTLARAFEKFKGFEKDRPGKGHGRDKARGDGPAGDDPGKVRSNG